jgi:anthranilate synthase component 2
MKGRLLTIDNYDSFAYNLVQYFEELGREVVVRRNDQIQLEEVADFDEIVLSPGPGIPDEAGLLKEIVREFAPSRKILGVCLGHQAIGEVFGLRLINLSRVLHGVGTPIQLLKHDYLYRNLPSEIQVGRYHSWVVDPELNDVLEATAVDADGQVMSFRHREYDVCGVQYHPESVLTPQGKTILKNWLTGKDEKRIKPTHSARNAE